MKTRFFTLATLALALAACNNDNENLNGDPVAAQFTANIAPATRASGTTWTGGDRIGITDIGNDSQYGNVPFILKNGKFEAEGKVIYIEDTKTHTFRAYYPYNTTGGILAATTDATAQQNKPAIDFLFASGATGDKNNPVVSFTDKTAKGGEDNSFHHRMSQITLLPSRRATAWISAWSSLNVTRWTDCYSPVRSTRPTVLPPQTTEYRPENWP